MYSAVFLALLIILGQMSWLTFAEIGCNLLPENRNRSEANQESKFGIIVQGSSFTIGGDPVKVTLRSTGQHPHEIILFRNFTLQAHDFNDEKHGRWEPISQHLMTRQCGMGEKDTLFNGDSMTQVVEVQALWYPDFPDTEELFNGNIDFNAAVLLENKDATFWTDIRSIELQAKNVHTDPRETEGGDSNTDGETEAPAQDPTNEDTGENPNEGEEVTQQEEQDEIDRDLDDHDLEMEESSKRKHEEEMERLLEEEDGESEKEYVKEEEQVRREEEERQHQEMVEYERRTAEEEKKRQEMIQWEIRDKEEYDRLLAEQTSIKPKADGEKDEEIIKDLGISGSTIPAASFIMMVLPLIMCFF